jgi:hypothetical protein
MAQEHDIHDIVLLKKDRPADGLRRGMRGTVVHVLTRPRRAYEVEFCDEDGRTVAQLALDPDEITRAEVTLHA